MCTVVVARNVFSEYPLVIASNRDERVTRPSTRPHLWDKVGVYAPIDLQSRGTWIGVSRTGLVSAITNRDEIPHAPGRASRGKLVLHALQQKNAREAVAMMQMCMTTGFYNGFHLVIVDVNEAFLLLGNGHELVVRTIRDGLHVVTAFGVEPSHAPRATEIERRFNSIVRRDGPNPVSINELLNFHGNGQSEESACVHDPETTHHTVSSMIVRVTRDWTAFDTWYRDGYACRGPFDSCVTIPIIKKDAKEGSCS